MKLSSTFLAAIFALGALPAAAATTGSSTPPTCTGDQPVWVNTKTKVYHLATDPLYGKTKHGTYMCKADADAAGDHMAKGGGKMGGASNMGSAAKGSSGSMGSTSTSGDQVSATPSPSASGAPSGKHHKHRKGGAMASPSPAPTAS